MEEIDKREAEHVTTMQALENEYEHKLAVEIAPMTMLVKPWSVNNKI